MEALDKSSECGPAFAPIWLDDGMLGGRYSVHGALSTAGVFVCRAYYINMRQFDASAWSCLENRLKPRG